MDKKLLVLTILIILSVITVSGCIGGNEDSSMNILDNDNQVNEEIIGENEEESDQEPNEEPEPIEDE